MVRFRGLVEGREVYGLAFTHADLCDLLAGFRLGVDLAAMDGPAGTLLVLAAEDQGEAFARVAALGGPDDEYEVRPDGAFLRFAPPPEPTP